MKSLLLVLTLLLFGCSGNLVDVGNPIQDRKKPPTIDDYEVPKVPEPTGGDDVTVPNAPASNDGTDGSEALPPDAGEQMQAPDFDPDNCLEEVSEIFEDASIGELLIYCELLGLKINE